MAKKENFKNSYTNKIKQNLEFFTEYEYIYKKNKLFNQLSSENQDLYHQSKTYKKLTNKDYKKLYDRAVNISYGIDHIADTVGLFTRKIKKPIQGSTLNKGDFQYIDFECGDLYLRKNVILKNDNIHCYKIFSKFVDKIDCKLNRFRWGMNYHVPTSKKETNKLINTQTEKHSLLCGPVFITTILYNFDNKDHILYLTADLIWTDLKAVVKLIKKLKNLKKIIFVDYGSIIIMEPRKLKHKEGLRHYIINYCNNPKFKWWSSAPRLKNSIHLDKLKLFRKSIQNNVTIEFFNSDYDIEVGDFYKDDCQKILRDANVIEN